MFKNPMYRNGKKCTIICTDKPGPQPIVTYCNYGVIRSHCENGRRWLNDVNHPWDIVETPPKSSYKHIAENDPVTVISRTGEKSYVAHFAGVNYLGDPLIYTGGQTSYTVERKYETMRVWKVEVIS